MNSIYDLISTKVFEGTIATKDLFDDLMQQEIDHQARLSSFYRKFLAESAWNLGNPIDSLPYLPVGAFKHQTHMTKIESEDRGLELKSSGTSGITSSIFVDRETSRRQKLSVRLTWEDYFGDERSPALVLDADPQNSEALGARQAAIMGYTRNSSTVEYLLKEENGKLIPSQKWFQVQQDLPSEPVVIIGFTYVLWRFLREQLGKSRIELPTGSRVIHIGGWKKLEAEKISPEDFKALVSSSLSVDSADIHDVYGFTELMGVSFIECSFGNKHVPKWVRATALDPITLEPLISGAQGLLAFRSPIAHSYLGLGIVTDDLGYVSDKLSKCGCGREGQIIQVSGRRGRAEIRGCGDILGSAKLEQTRSEGSQDSINLLFPEKLGLGSSAFQKVVTETTNESRSITTLTLPEKLEVISELRERWKLLSDSDFTGRLRKNGIGFLIDWSNPDRLRQVLDDSLPEGRASLDNWVERHSAPGRKIRAIPRGVLSQWVSGNVPALGMFPIIYGWLTNNVSLSRLSTKAFELTIELLDPLNELATISPAARKMAESTLVFTFDHNNEAANSIISRAADTVIAWGGEAAISAISQLPMKPSARTLYFGPRTSYAVVFESAVNTHNRMAVIARRLVADSTVFEQAACASPHSVFLVSGDEGLSEKLAAALADEFSREASKETGLLIDKDLVSEIALYRRRRMLDSKIFPVGHFATVVVPMETLSLPEPVFGKTLHVVQVKDIHEMDKYLSPYLQSVSIAGTQKESEDLAESLVCRGVKRFPSVGRITNFENPWDGEDIINLLVRNATLGGP